MDAGKPWPLVGHWERRAQLLDQQLGQFPEGALDRRDVKTEIPLRVERGTFANHRLGQYGPAGSGPSLEWPARHPSAAASP